MDYSKCRILLFRGKGFISWGIRTQTRSQYSHAAILMPDGRIVEAWQGAGAGVQIKTLDDYTGIDAFIVKGMNDTEWRLAIDYALSQVGSKYDYWAIVRFISRPSMPTNDKWFCSELVFASLARAGINLLERITASEVSPGLLSFSPILIPASRPA